MPRRAKRAPLTIRFARGCDPEPDDEVHVLKRMHGEPRSPLRGYSSPPGAPRSRRAFREKLQKKRTPLRSLERQREGVTAYRRRL